MASRQRQRQKKNSVLWRYLTPGKVAAHRLLSSLTRGMPTIIRCSCSLVWMLKGVNGICRERAKQMEEDIIAEGRMKAHKEAEPSNGKAVEREERDRRGDERRHDSSKGQGRRRERSESPDWDRHRDDRKRRQRHSRSRSPDRHR